MKRHTMSPKHYFIRFKTWITRQVSKVKPGKTAVKGAAIGLLSGSFLLFGIEVIGMTINFRDPWILLLGLVILVVSVVAALLTSWLIKQLNAIPKGYKIALIISIPLLILVRLLDQRLMVVMILIFSLLGAGVSVFKITHFRKLTFPKKAVAILGFAIGLLGAGASLYFLMIRGLEMKPLINAAKLAEENITPLPFESPATAGRYEVEFFTYGSGKDIRRKEFADEVSYQTESVDGTAFLDHWEGMSGKYRSHYWGFDYRELPVNGRVWKPKGEGPFPLVLIVHGNHPMQDFSDPGYEYLGELMASRGYIFVSVDENFLNGSWSDFPDGLEKENDARAWMLLEHLRQWKEWTQDSGHALFGQVDLDKLALIGHSRGGEAVAHAAMLNRLDYYPDDASIPLGYHFNIQAIVAIAPVDGQYKPGGSLNKLENISYLGIHGAQDADVESFDGLKQFERISFTDSIYRFKAGIYIAGANHGQFNSSWGDNDVLASFSGLLNKQQLMDSKDQETISKVYISAFLETTLQRKDSFLPLFTDARKGRNWLPETIYLSQFQDSESRFWAGFDEDFEVRTLSKAESAQGENLTVWREGEVMPKYGLRGTRAVYLGWNYEEFGGDSLDWEALDKPALPDTIRASFTVKLGPDTFRPDSSSVLIFSMAESGEPSNPKSKGKWIDENKEEEEDGNSENESTNSDEDEPKEAEEEDDEEEKALPVLDFSIELFDDQGERIVFLASEFSPVQRLIQSRVLKIQFLDEKDESEPIFQLYQFELQKIAARNPRFKLESLQQIRFLFDQSEQGVLILDQLGVMPSFEAGRYSRTGKLE
jgi:dienelactone hydrolase